MSKRLFVAVATWVLGVAASGALAEPADVLLLGDAGSEGQVTRALRAAGHNVVFAGFHADWDGVDPDVNDFDVVVYLDGNSYGYGLQSAADAAVAAFVAAGGGFVITEWAAYDVYHAWMSPGVSALMPVSSPEGDYDDPGLWVVSDPTDPLAAWLPDQWGDQAGFSYVVPHANATVVLESATGTPFVTYRTDTGGTSVHVNHSLTYDTETINRHSLQAVVNAVEFAAGLEPPDCNENGVPDFLDVRDSTSSDVNRNHVPDECDPDCNENGIPDDLDVRPGSGFTQVGFEFDVTTPAEWDFVNNCDVCCDDCVTPTASLPFSLELGGETLTQFAMSSNGYVELFRDGETAYGPSYGSVGYLTDYSTPSHTYLLGAYDDLNERYFGGYGYRTEPGRVTFYWETQTYEDADGTYAGVNIYQIAVESDGTVQWNFGSEAVMAYGNNLFTGLYLGYDARTLYELYAGELPEQESWVFVGPTPAYSEDVDFDGVPDECEPDCNGNGLPDDMDVAPPIDPGLTQVSFRFLPAGSLEWSDADDTCNSGPVSLPFPVTFGGETYVAFQQTSDGCVELLRAGETPYGFLYGYVADLIAYTAGNPGAPHHTYLLAAFDDLDSGYNGIFGYRFEDTQVVFYWYTETYEDDDDGLHNEFEIILSDDASVWWNFGSAFYSSYGYDLFSGIYLGHGDQILHEITRDRIPEFESWVFTEAGLPGGGSDDLNANGIPDECEDRGDMNDDGTVDLADLPAFRECLKGPGLTVGPECERADFDADADVDLHDVAGFFAAFTP
jgi:hypothetical protein